MLDFTVSRRVFRGSEEVSGNVARAPGLRTLVLLVFCRGLKLAADHV